MGLIKDIFELYFRPKKFRKDVNNAVKDVDKTFKKVEQDYDDAYNKGKEITVKKAIWGKKGEKLKGVTVYKIKKRKKK